MQRQGARGKSSPTFLLSDEPTPCRDELRYGWTWGRRVWKACARLEAIFHNVSVTCLELSRGWRDRINPEGRLAAHKASWKKEDVLMSEGRSRPQCSQTVNGLHIALWVSAWTWSFGGTPMTVTALMLGTAFLVSRLHIWGSQHILVFLSRRRNISNHQIKSNKYLLRSSYVWIIVLGL